MQMALNPRASETHVKDSPPCSLQFICPPRRKKHLEAQGVHLLGPRPKMEELGEEKLEKNKTRCQIRWLRPGAKQNRGQAGRSLCSPRPRKSSWKSSSWSPPCGFAVSGRFGAFRGLPWFHLLIKIPRKIRICSDRFPLKPTGGNSTYS